MWDTPVREAINFEQHPSQKRPIIKAMQTVDFQVEGVWGSSPYLNSCLKLDWMMRQSVLQLAYDLVPHCVFLPPANTTVSRWTSQPHMDLIVYRFRDIFYDMLIMNSTSLSTELILESIKVPSILESQGLSHRHHCTPDGMCVV